VDRFTGHSQVVTTNNYNTLKITVTIANKIKSSMCAYYSLLGNESYLVNTSQLYTQLLKCLLKSLTNESLTELNCQSQSYITTDGQSASLSWNKAPIWGLRPDLCYCQTFAGLFMWGSLSDDRTGLSFPIAAGPRQRNHFLVRLPWDS
jgi:hypothetical protein